jgi:hypothetical protein
MLNQLRQHIPNFELPLDVAQYLSFDDESFAHVLKYHLGSSFDEVSGQLHALLLSRRLWKRVYEESHPASKMMHSPTLTAGVLQFLRRRGLDAELIESETSLTQFSPRGRRRKNDAASTNSLRILTRHTSGRLSLQAIEDHSRLINDLDEERVIQRVFVKPQGQNLAEIRRSIADYLGRSESDDA